MISIDSVTKTYGEKELFNEISFTISAKERVGLIGVNGTGKSSLLKIVAGVDFPDSGEVTAPKDYRIAYSEQNPDLNPELTVLDQVFAGEAPVLKLLKEYEETLLELHKVPDDSEIQEKLFDLQKKMDALDGWDASTNAKTILNKLGIEEYEKKIGELSGGQKKRVALAQVLIQSPD